MVNEVAKDISIVIEYVITKVLIIAMSLQVNDFVKDLDFVLFT